MSILSVLLRSRYVTPVRSTITFWWNFQLDLPPLNRVCTYRRQRLDLCDYLGFWEVPLLQPLGWTRSLLGFYYVSRCVTVKRKTRLVDLSQGTGIQSYEPWSVCTDRIWSVWSRTADSVSDKIYLIDRCPSECRWVKGTPLKLHPELLYTVIDLSLFFRRSLPIFPWSFRLTIRTSIGTSVCIL